MCDYTQVEYSCGHLRYTVRAWCVKYQETHKRCPANVVAIEYRLDEKCDADTRRYRRLPRHLLKTHEYQDEGRCFGRFIAFKLIKHPVQVWMSVMVA
ncbi:hypothetical protein W97_06203 [Coniosporium apollinis CBS 100218]|uniref:Uncharacterized protein n=1 Tax=Coniosporium apollinis (strain CBS 100218) TaxID=1168221 RepID=R7YYR1_CONA1|nr:uncharacterized protein W97_06203 [Coniosporium apollinis CBS 100218]EON66801.1 hypothetical protein W97_06203 [Coniosporium apollinis CBS 100218]